jgi:hypothetical protein
MNEEERWFHEEMLLRQPILPTNLNLGVNIVLNNTLLPCPST